MHSLHWFEHRVRLNRFCASGARVGNRELILEHDGTESRRQLSRFTLAG